jgi:hypothetical protein
VTDDKLIESEAELSIEEEADEAPQSGESAELHNVDERPMWDSWPSSCHELACQRSGEQWEHTLTRLQASPLSLSRGVANSRAVTSAAVALKLKHPLSFHGVVAVQELENVRSACHNLTNLKAELLAQTQGDMVPCARCVVQMKGATEMFEVDSVDSP